MSAIDVWAQQVTPRMAAQPWMESLLRWTRQEASDMVPTPAQTIAAMDAAGVEISLLSAWHGPSGSLITNEEVRATVALAPDRFRGVATVDLADPVGAVRTIREVVDGEQFVAVRIVPWLWELPPDHRLFYPVYVACVEAGVPVCTQIGHTGPLRTSETGRPIPYLERVLLDFPDLTVVGGHVGFPWLDEVASLMAKFPNFHVDTSAYTMGRLPADLVALAAGLGRGKVMFGTNWPMISPEHALRDLDSLGWSDEVRAEVLHETARRVFRLPGGG